MTSRDVLFQFRFYGDRLPEEPENVLYLSNHQCTS